MDKLKKLEVIKNYLIAVYKHIMKLFTNVNKLKQIEQIMLFTE